MAALSSFFEQVIAVLSSYRPVQDTLDILLVTLIIYELIKLIRRTRSVQIFKGLAILFVVYIVVLICDMPVMKSIFETIFSSALVILIILFTPEIRNVLERMGRTSVFKIFAQKQYSNASTLGAINSVCSACSEMSDDKIGALIVFERKSMLGEIMKTGTKINADVSSSLIRNIFYPKSPLHDGALIIRAGRIAAAGCVLPLTKSTNLSKELGMRHRAGIGLSEQSDAVVVIVSEETGAISVAIDGMLKRHLNATTFERLLRSELIVEETDDKPRGFIQALKKLIKGLTNETDKHNEKTV